MCRKTTITAKDPDGLMDTMFDIIDAIWNKKLTTSEGNTMTRAGTVAVQSSKMVARRKPCPGNTKDSKGGK